MKKIYIFIILITVSTTITFAQNKDTKKADDLYNRLAYTDAAVAYQKLLKKGKGNRYVYEQLANSYYFINDSKKAETFYKRVVKGKKVTRNNILIYSISLIVICPAPWYLGYLGNIYGFLTTFLTLIFMYFSWNVYKEKLGAEPILFKYSILYLFLLFLIMPIDKYFYMWIN